NRVAVEAAAERDALEHLHQNFAAAGNAAEGRATADSFPKSCKIRHNAIELLRSAKGETKAGDHFVEYQQNPARGAKFANLIEIAGPGQNAPAVAQHRLHGDGRDAAAVRVENAHQDVDVVPGC